MRRVARQGKDNRRLTVSRHSRKAGSRQEGGCGNAQPGGRRAPRAPRGGQIACGMRWPKRWSAGGHRFCRSADDAHGDVRSTRAGLRGMAAGPRFVAGHRRRTVHRANRVGDRPWHGTGRGDTGTTNRHPRWQPAPTSVQRATERRRQSTPRGRGHNSRGVSEESNRVTRGGGGSCRRSQGQQPCDTVAQWLHRRWRNILGEQWRKPQPRWRKLLARGLAAARARTATATGLGVWGNAGASHRPAAVNNRGRAAWGRRSRLEQLRAMPRPT